MDGRQSQGIAELRLSDGKLNRVALGAADHLQAQIQLADQVRHVGRRGEASHGRQPFPVNGAVDERAEPQQPREVREFLGDLLERRMRDIGDAAIGERQHAVIHRLQEEAVKIDEIACDMDRRNLPPSV